MRLLLLFTLVASAAQAQAVPDTTAPWRYFPLHVGDAWEYHRFPTGLPQIDLGTRRVDIEEDTLINGTRYVIHRSLYYDENGVPSQSGPVRTPIRYDTLTATVRAVTNDGSSEYLYGEDPCPFDAPFGGTVLCREYEDEVYYTSGGYDEGTLSFPDTSFAVTYKGYANTIGVTTSYAAGYGRFAFSHDNGNTHVLEYVRIDGVEYGTPVYPLPNEPVRPEQNQAFSLEAWPNPFGDRLTVAFKVEQPKALRLELFDARGRRVQLLDLGLRPSGHHEVRLDGSALAPGLYLLRLSGSRGAHATTPIVRG